MVHYPPIKRMEVVMNLNSINSINETWNERTALVQSSIRIFMQEQLRNHFFDTHDEHEIADKMAAYFSVLMGE